MCSIFFKKVSKMFMLLSGTKLTLPFLLVYIYILILIKDAPLPVLDFSTEDYFPNFLTEYQTYIDHKKLSQTVIFEVSSFSLDSSFDLSFPSFLQETSIKKDQLLFLKLQIKN